MKSEPQKEHHWLQQLVGEWTYELEAAMGPDQPKQTFKATEVVRSLGGLWVLCESETDTPGGGTSKSVMTLGYDPKKERFVGTFVGAMMSFLWVYEGTLDAAEKVLTLNTDGPSFEAEGKTAKFKDVMAVKSPDERELSSHMQRQDGTWQEVMIMRYRRKK